MLLHHLRRALLGTAILLAAAAPAMAQTPAWQPIEIDLIGPQGQESGGGFNPFLDRRLDVTFELLDEHGAPTGTTYRVPGFFAADGNAAVTHATSGNVWSVRFTPDQPGTWRWTAEFYEGSNVAVANLNNLGSNVAAARLNQTSNTFQVGQRDPTAEGFLSRGRLAYVGGHYLQTLGDGKYWIKSGANSPENLLGYLGFDSTVSLNAIGPDHTGDFSGTADKRAYGRLHYYASHRNDWSAGDPNWQRGDSVPGSAGPRDGKNLIGTLNYLASQGVNSVYFLPMNLGGDAEDTHPFITPDDAGDTRYDVSKLEQWEIAFAHAQRLGIHLHVVLNEAENDNKNFLDNATLGTERKLFYRELVARFGHHNALQWNLSEEYNGNGAFGSSSQEEADRVLQFGAYLSQIDPYDHPMTVHNAQSVSADNGGQWRFFFGEEDIDLTSLQEGGEADGLSDIIENFRTKTANAGRPIPVMVDEVASLHNVNDGTGLNRPDATRIRMTWDIYLSGGGVEWYMGNRDQALENFRSEDGVDLEQVWRETTIARRFMEQHLPFWLMQPDDELVSGETAAFGGAEVFALPGEIYAIYYPDASNTGQLDLSDADGNMLLRWFDPTFGAFIGDGILLAGGTIVDMPAAPSALNAGGNRDWVALVVPEPNALAAMLIAPLLLGRRRTRQWRARASRTCAMNRRAALTGFRP